MAEVEKERIFANALATWTPWNFRSFAVRKEPLLGFRKAMQRQAKALSEVVSFHIHAASALLAEIHRMSGVTGETNELYPTGRGVSLILVEPGDNRLWPATLAFLTAALAAGNSVIIASDDRALFATLEPALARTAFPGNLVQLVPYDDYRQLLGSDLGCVAYVGNPEMERRLNRELADREGAIIGLCSETNPDALPHAHDPLLSLRFVTERTRTINVTAVGGNAALLAFGGEARSFFQGGNSL